MICWLDHSVLSPSNVTHTYTRACVLTDDGVGHQGDIDRREHEATLCRHPTHARYLQDLSEVEQLRHRVPDHLSPDLYSSPTSAQDLGSFTTNSQTYNSGTPL